MVTKIANGDYAVDHLGRFITSSGVDEIIERALIRLKVKKGSFTYDNELGSELHLVDLNTADYDLLIAIISEALSPIQQIEVTGVERQANKDDKALTLTVYIRINNENAIIELY